MTKVKEFRDKSITELQENSYTLQKELFKLRFQAKTGRLEKPSQIRNIKKDIARINTILKEKEDGQKTEPKKD